MKHLSLLEFENICNYFLCVFFKNASSVSSTEFISYCQALFITLLELFIPNYLSTQVITSSDHLSRSIYECNWIEQSSQFKMSMKIFVAYSSKPMVISLYKNVLPLHLETFVSVKYTYH